MFLACCQPGCSSTKTVVFIKLPCQDQYSLKSCEYPNRITLGGARLTEVAFMLKATYVHFSILLELHSVALGDLKCALFSPSPQLHPALASTDESVRFCCPSGDSTHFAPALPTRMPLFS